MRPSTLLFFVSILAASSSALAAPKLTELRLRARVTEIRLNRLRGTQRHFIVRTQVLEVLRGQLKGKRFDFRIHSPARAGLRKGSVITFRARPVKGGAGYLVDEASLRGAPSSRPVSRTSATAPPPSAWSKELRCRRHRDCVFAYYACPSCPICAPDKPRWRSVTNRETYNRQRAYYRRHRVRCAPCRPCRTRGVRRLGTRPYCRRGQCAVK